MTPRQLYALEHPLETAVGGARALQPYTLDRRHATGLLLRTVLAVDR